MSIVIKQIVGMLPLSQKVEKQITYKVFTKEHQIKDLEELKQFVWLKSGREDEVCVVFTDKSEAVKFYGLLKQLKIIIYTDFLIPNANE